MSCSPYQMVKDLRTGVQTSDHIQACSTADLDEFMAATLAQRAFGAPPPSIEDVELVLTMLDFVSRLLPMLRDARVRSLLSNEVVVFQRVRPHPEEVTKWARLEGWAANTDL